MNGRGAAKIGLVNLEAKEPRSKRHELPEVVIGKDVLELVSHAMYTDPMTVYREYIQNAADAIDVARNDGSLSSSEAGRVDISIDPSTRTVRIRDNGCGLPFRDFGRNLTALGGSAKRGTPTRGFRGVGRLAGLAYVQELIFRSRVQGEAHISQLTWDCRRLKAAMRETPYDVSVADLICQVASLEQVSIDDAPERFFEVEMRGVIRLKNDWLLSPSAISEYLSQVAPVPFSPEFEFGPRISQALSPHVDLASLDIRVNSAEKPVYKPHRDSVNCNGKATLNFSDLSIVKIPSIDEGVAAVAWILHHEYEGAIPASALVKGLRLRSGNIQVGGHAPLEDLFSEPRFNSWSVGEIHVVDRRIVPNGRRDDFEQNGHLNNLLNHFAPTTRDLARRCRTSSVRRRWEREFDACAQSAAERIGIIRQGSTSRKRKQEFALSVEQTFLHMAKIASKEQFEDTVDARNVKIDELRKQLSVAMNDDLEVSSPLMRLPAAKRKSYENFFDLVYQCSTNRTAAKALVDRILQSL